MQNSLASLESVLCLTWVGVDRDPFDFGSHFLHFILCNVPSYLNAAWGKPLGCNHWRDLEA